MGWGAKAFPFNDALVKNPGPKSLQMPRAAAIAVHPSCSTGEFENDTVYLLATALGGDTLTGGTGADVESRPRLQGSQTECGERNQGDKDTKRHKMRKFAVA
jgi:hypothetical protein